MNPDSRDLPTETIVEMKSQGYSYRKILDKFRETHPDTTLTENMLANRVKRYRKTHPEGDVKTRRSYESRSCKVCGVKYILGPLDPDVGYCPFHAYEMLNPESELNPDGLKDNPDSGGWERVSDPYGDQRTQKTWKRGDVIVRIKYLPHTRSYEVRKDDVSKDELLSSESANSYKSAMIIADRMREFDRDRLKRNPSFEPKVKVFNEKGDVSEYKVKEAISEEKPEEEESAELSCPECGDDLVKVKDLEFNDYHGLLKYNVPNDYPVQFYECEKCGKVYWSKLEKVREVKDEDCPYCEEPLSKVKGSELLYCRNCHKVFKED